MTNDPHAALKSAQKEAWATFSPTAVFTLQPAAALVRFAGIAAGQEVLTSAAARAWWRSPRANSARA